MSHISLAQRGLKAVEDRQYEAAIPLLTRALAVSKSPLWLLARAQAHQQTGRLQQALRDSELAYVAASGRQEPRTVKNLVDAQYRRAVVLFRLGRLADADACCVWSQRLCEGKPAREQPDPVLAELVDAEGNYTASLAAARAQKPPGEGAGQDLQAAMGNSPGGKGAMTSDWTRAYMWRSNVLTAMEKLPVGDPGRKLTAIRVPHVSLDDPIDIAEDAAMSEASSVSVQPSAAVAAATGTTSAVGREVKKTGPVQKLKVDFYQTNDQVTWSVFVKDADKERLQVNIKPGVVELHNIHREDPGITTAILIPDQPIVPTVVRQSVTPRKIELTLKKETPGKKWGRWGQEVLPDKDPAVTEDRIRSLLGGAEATTTTSSENVHVSPPSVSATAAAPSQDTSKLASTPTAKSSQAETKASRAAGPPSYPTSSKHGAKNWERVAADEEAESAEAEKQDVDFFFKQLFKNASPEQQRAMMKSYTESNGTALSTNWDDVKDRTVETKPPEGVEAKKWGQ